MNNQGTESGAPRAADPLKVILDEVEVRARATPRLKEYLSGLVSLVLTDSGRTLNFDWRTQDLKVTEGPVPAAAAAGVGAEAPAEHEKRAVARLSTENLVRISRGDLNPQVAMLSGKVQVTGAAGLGIYVFNLIAPRPRM